MPDGLTIDASTGTIRWVPIGSQAGGNYDLVIQLCDGGSPNFCVTNTFSIGVTTNAPFSFDILQMSGNTFQFTIQDGRTDRDYILQAAAELCQCPCQTVWQDAARVSPITIPYSFTHTRTNLSNEPTRFFKLREAPRTGP